LFLVSLLGYGVAVHPCTIMLKRALYSIGKEREEEKRRGTRGTDSWLDDTDKKLLPIYLYCLTCTKFGQLIVQKIIKIVATRCQILRLKFTKFDFGWCSAPDPAGGAYSTPPDLLAGFKGKGKGLYRHFFFLTSSPWQN